MSKPKHEEPAEEPEAAEPVEEPTEPAEVAYTNVTKDDFVEAEGATLRRVTSDDVAQPEADA